MKLTGVLVLLLAGAVPAAVGGRATVEPEIEMEDFTFRPARMVVARGALVEVEEPRPCPAQRGLDRSSGRRNEAVPHAGRSDFGERRPARAPRRAGTYRYLCTVHPNMRGTLVVR